MRDEKGIKDHTYSLHLVSGDKREVILEAEKSLHRVRNVAQKIRVRFGRRVVILRDGKEMPRGSLALDGDAYADWLKTHIEPETLE